MWLFSKQGFVSIVKDRYCEEDEVVIRARKREDLEAVLDMMETERPGIIELPHTDYRYRTIVKQRDFALAVAHIAMEIQYPNFKSAACPPGSDMKRTIAYHQCWDVLRKLQEGEGADTEASPLWDAETEGEA